MFESDPGNLLLFADDSSFFMISSFSSNSFLKRLISVSKSFTVDGSTSFEFILFLMLSNKVTTLYNIYFEISNFRIVASTNLSSFKLSNYAISFVSFYIFYTSRDANIAGDEFAAFLGLRGGYFCDKDGVLHSKPGRPVLRHTEISPLYRRRESKSDGSIITRKQMINDIGFKVFGGVIFVILVTHYKHAISGKVLK